jgi:toxin ParE1/3/4
MQLVWTLRALRQQDRIGTYIAKDNPPAATQLLKAIKKKSQMLTKHPFIGRRTEFDQVRELVVHTNYLLSYRVNAQRVEILQVWHVAQQRYH